MKYVPNCVYKIDQTQLHQISEINLDCPIYYSDHEKVLKKRPIYVVSQDSAILGYLSYNSNYRSLIVEYIGIRRELRRSGFGSILICKLIEDAIDYDRTIVVKVEGSDIASLKFFSNNGFKAIAIICEDVFEYYLMEWSKNGNVLFSSVC